MSKPFKVLCCVFAITFASMSVFADEEKDSPPPDDPTAKIVAPASYKTKKIILFPLEIPGYALKAVTWPIGALVQVVEDTHLISKATDFFSNKDKTLWYYPYIEGGAGTGFGGGLGLRLTNAFNEGYQFRARYAIHVNLNQYFFTSFGKRNSFELFGRKCSFSSEFNWVRTRNMDYYGVGAASSQSNHSQFLQSDIRWQSWSSMNVGRNLYAGITLGVTTDASGWSPYGGNPNTTDVFSLSTLPGYGGWHTYFIGGFDLTHDTRDDMTRPTKGGKRLLGFTRFQDIKENFSYNTFTADFIQHIPLWRRGFQFVLHNGWLFEQAMGNDVIPFFRLAMLDADNYLSGFARGRFRDRAKVTFNIQYLYPIWNMVDGIFFFDTGRVFDGVSNFSFKNFRYSGGGGLDLHLFQLTFFKFRAAYGGEGLNLYFGVTRTI